MGSIWFWSGIFLLLCVCVCVWFVSFARFLVMMMMWWCSSWFVVFFGVFRFDRKFVFFSVNDGDEHLNFILSSTHCSLWMWVWICNVVLVGFGCNRLALHTKQSFMCCVFITKKPYSVGCCVQSQWRRKACSFFSCRCLSVGRWENVILSCNLINVSNAFLSCVFFNFCIRFFCCPNVYMLRYTIHLFVFIVDSFLLSFSLFSEQHTMNTQPVMGNTNCSVCCCLWFGDPLLLTKSIIIIKWVREKCGKGQDRAQEWEEVEKLETIENNNNNNEHEEKKYNNTFGIARSISHAYTHVVARSLTQ